ncbi:MAG: FUSC family protein [Methylacidiphilales bacterium]|nr:FUSC family protein [Candidatus Methylacidiphilales bacterium]
MNKTLSLAWFPLPAFSPLVRDRIGFALRAWVASMLALYVSFVLQLDAPYWSLLTVWIVAQPTPGMLLSKSLYLFIGTIAGVIFGITLIALFAQTPELFVFALAVLVGGCTVASNILTNFRAYSTVLAAYSAGIIASDAINVPDQVFFIGMSRGASILTGVACSIFVTSIFAPYRAEGETRKKLLAALKDAARRAVYSWQANNEARLQIGRKLIFDLITLNTLIEFASAESGTFRLQANQGRRLLAHIFSLISARRSLDAHLARCGWPRHNALEIFHEVVIDFLNEMPDQLDRGQIDELIVGIGDVRHQLEILQPERETVPSEELVSERFVIDQLDDLLVHLEGALEEWRDIVQGNLEKVGPRQDLNFHRDLRAAWINGLRAFLAVGITGAFWIASAWDHGPSALIFVAVLMSLFSTQPHPDRVGWTFFYAGMFAAAMALICKYLLLPMSAEFGFCALVLGLFLLPLGWLFSDPTKLAMAGGFSFVFVTLVQTTNPMIYNLSETLNTGLAILVGILLGTISYLVIFPPDPRAARRYVTYRIRRGLAWLAQMGPVPASSSHWETRMYDRVVRLNDPQNLSGTPTDEWLDAGLSALTLGNEILRLRRWLATEKLSVEVETAIEKIMDAFSRSLCEPGRVVTEVRDRMQEVLRLDPGIGEPGRLAWARAQGAMAEIDFFLARNPLLTKADTTLC